MKKIGKVAVVALLLAGLTFGGIKLASLIKRENLGKKYSIVMSQHHRILLQLRIATCFSMLVVIRTNG